MQCIKAFLSWIVVQISLWCLNVCYYMQHNRLFPYAFSLCFVWIMGVTSVKLWLSRYCQWTCLKVRCAKTRWQSPYPFQLSVIKRNLKRMKSLTNNFQQTMNNPKSSNKSFHSNITVVISLYHVIYLYAVWMKNVTSFSRTLMNVSKSFPPFWQTSNCISLF